MPVGAHRVTQRARGPPGGCCVHAITADAPWASTAAVPAAAPRESVAAADGRDAFRGQSNASTRWSTTTGFWPGAADDPRSSKDDTTTTARPVLVITTSGAPGTSVFPAAGARSATGCGEEKGPGP